MVANEIAAFGNWGLKTNWRPSAGLGGSPGSEDSAPATLAPVQINELLSNDANGGKDVVELGNPTAQPANIGGWFLTDDPAAPKKHRIPDGTLIPAGGSVMLNESAFNQGGLGFAFSSRGDSVYLFSGDAQTNLTGYVQSYSFGAADPGVTFGRYVTSQGEDHFVAQSAPTLGAENAPPKVGPVVITEIMYHPADVFATGAYWDNTEDEYIELYNHSGSPVPLFDEAYPANRWKLRAGVDYTFPAGTTLPAHGYLLLVNFDPVKDPAQLARFQARSGVPPGLPLLGPFKGKLSNAGESVELAKPGAPKIGPDQQPEPPPYILVDQVKYSSTAPWPGGGDGIGLSLQRKQPGQYGNDPINWTAAAPHPGTPFLGGDLPVIVAQPQSLTAVAFQVPSWGYPPSSMQVAAQSASPLRYQWRFHGANVVGATHATWSFTNLQLNQAGDYSVVVFNAAGSVDSQAATMTLKQPPVITVQPQGKTVIVPPGGAGTNLLLSVTALGINPLTYQWRLAGTNLAGATGSTLPLTIYGLENAGVYTVLVRDQVGPMLSQPARVTALIKPIIVTQPQSQTALVGDNVRFNVVVTPDHPSLPLGYRWRKNGGTIVPFGVGTSELVLTNVQLASAGTYSVIVTNAASTSGVLSGNALLTVLADTDGDHMDDAWELAHGLDPMDPKDALLDSDGDGMMNVEEYIAGTDPQDPQSYLKVDAIAIEPGLVTLQFVAVSNKTYSVQWKQSVEAGLWQSFINVSGGDRSMTVTVTDPQPPVSGRIYRLVTPRLP